MIKLLFISLTNKCNRACPYCPIQKYVNNPTYPNNLPLNELCLFISRAKPDYIELTGGEPTLYKDYEKLCDWLDANNFKYLTKSNGDFKGRNQISAWHTDFPKFYDKILIIRDNNGWEDKQKHCENFKIPFHVIGKNNNNYEANLTECEQMFICPDGRIKQCHEMEICGYSENNRYTIKDEPHWEKGCAWCKSVNDYMVFQ